MTTRIYELGVAHLGSEERALAMTHIIAKNDPLAYIKFQWADLQRLYHKGLQGVADSVVRAIGFKNWYKEFYAAVSDLYPNVKIGVSVFDIRDIWDLMGGTTQNTPFFDFLKLPSPEVQDRRLLEAVLNFSDRIPVFISCGSCNIADLEVTLTQMGNGVYIEPGNVHLMHCITKYPASPSDMADRMTRAFHLLSICKRTGCHFGLSDHDPSFFSFLKLRERVGLFAIDSVEKHVCLPTTDALYIPTIDDASSLPLTPGYVHAFVGVTGQDAPLSQHKEWWEFENYRSFRFWIATKHIQKGDCFSPNNTTQSRMNPRFFEEHGVNSIKSMLIPVSQDITRMRALKDVPSNTAIGLTAVED